MRKVSRKTLPSLTAAATDVSLSKALIHPLMQQCGNTVAFLDHSPLECGFGGGVYVCVCSSNICISNIQAFIHM